MGVCRVYFLIVSLRWLIVEYFRHQLQLYLVQHVHWWQPICSQLVTRCNTSFNMNMICNNLPYCMEVSFLVSRCVGRQAVAADSLPFHVIAYVFGTPPFALILSRSVSSNTSCGMSCGTSWGSCEVLWSKGAVAAPRCVVFLPLRRRRPATFTSAHGRENRW